MMGTCQKIPFTVKESEIGEGALKILEKVRPNWASGHVVKTKVFTEGISNKLLGFYLESDPEEMVMVRVYGAKTELLIDRDAEIKTMMFLQKRGSGPEVYATFNNGIAYEFIPGKILSIESCRDPSIYSLVAAQMAKMHSFLDDSMDQKPIIWSKLQSFHQLGEESRAGNPELSDRIDKLGLNRGWGTNAIKELEDMIRPKDMPIGFCHNDLLLGNIIFDEKRNKISFIDFEYAATNYIPFDIANHFCEFAGVDDADFSKCPDDNFKRDWIAHYLKNSQLNGHITSGDDIETYLNWVNLNMPLAHLFWILWSVFQAAHSTIDFDFVNYIDVRLKEYKRLMQELRCKIQKP